MFFSKNDFNYFKIPTSFPQKAYFNFSNDQFHIFQKKWFHFHIFQFQLVNIFANHKSLSETDFRFEVSSNKGFTYQFHTKKNSHFTNIHKSQIWTNITSVFHLECITTRVSHINFTRCLDFRFGVSSNKHLPYFTNTRFHFDLSNSTSKWVNSRNIHIISPLCSQNHSSGLHNNAHMTAK